MKKITYIFLSIAFLASCTNLASLNATATPQATFTLTLTSTPTITPTITFTPTETPDPNKPFDATGKDPSSGEYTKTVIGNDKEVTYVWKQIELGNDRESGVKGHWFESRMTKGAIDLTGYGENYRDSWGKITLNMNVYFIEGLSGLDKIGYLYHPAGESDYITKGFESETLASRVAFDLFRRYSGLIPEQPQTYYQDSFTKFREKYYSGDPTKEDAEKQQFFNDWQAFVSALKNGATIKVGNDLWEPRKGYDVYWIDEAIAAEDTSMHLSVQAYTTKNFYWKILISDGKLIAVIAPSEWLIKELSRNEAQRRESHFRFVTLFPLQAVLTTENLSEDISPFWYQDYGGMSGGLKTINGQSISTDFIAFTTNCKLQ